jgi:hypothetical protein
VKKFVLAAAIGLLLMGCGAAPGAGSHPSPTPSGQPGLGFDVGAGDQDQAITMRVGEKLEVVLHARNGMNNWTHPKSADETILAPIPDPAASAARGVTLAAFKAMRPGTVQVTSTSSPYCPPNAACAMYLAVYNLKVTITQ